MPARKLLHAQLWHGQTDQHLGLKRLHDVDVPGLVVWHRLEPLATALDVPPGRDVDADDRQGGCAEEGQDEVERPSKRGLEREA